MTYLRRNLGTTSRKFWEDFDLLPKEMKDYLNSQDRMPTSDDVKAAWELVAEGSGLDVIKSRLHAFEAERKQAAKDEAERLKGQRKQDRLDKFRKRHIQRSVMAYVRVVPRTDKHANLVAKVTEERAVELMAKRKENKDVKVIQPYFIPVFLTKKEVKEKELNFMEFEHKDSISKTYHNA